MTKEEKTKERLRLSQEGLRKVLKRRSDDLYAKIKEIGVECLKDLSDREREVIELRSGMRGKYYTLEEVGKIQGGVTRQAISLVERRAIKKIDNWVNAKSLIW